MRELVAAVSLVGLFGLSPALAASPPPGVTTFAKQLSERCEGNGGKPSVEGRLTQSLDVNGDKLTDWVLDESAMSCAGSKLTNPTGATQIMVFAGAKDGDAQPVFQQAAYGVRIEGAVVWLALRGPQCGAKGESGQFCDRPLVWNAKSGRVGFAPIAKVRSPSRIRQ